MRHNIRPKPATAGTDYIIIQKLIPINKYFTQSAEADTEDTEDNVTKKISEILCALCGSVVNLHFLEFLNHSAPDELSRLHT